jgi:hypothetical protein
MYSAAMTKIIQVRDVPDTVHEELARQAANAGLSLNRFMLQEFERIARRSRNAEIFRRSAERTARSGKVPTREQIVEAIREARGVAE